MELHRDLLMPNAALAVAELIAVGILSWLITIIGSKLIVAFAHMELSEGKRCMSDERAKSLASHFSRLIKAAGGLAALAVIGYNFWLTAEGYNGQELVVRQVQESDSLTLPVLAAKLGGIIGVLVLVKLLSWLGQQFREWIVGVLIGAEIVRVADQRVERIGDHFSWLLRAVLWLVGATLLAELFSAPETAVYWVNFLFTLGVIWGLVRLITDSMDAAIDAVYEGLMIAHLLGEGGRCARGHAACPRLAQARDALGGLHRRGLFRPAQRPDRRDGLRPERQCSEGHRHSRWRPVAPGHGDGHHRALQ